MPRCEELLRPGARLFRKLGGFLQNSRRLHCDEARKCAARGVHDDGLAYHGKSETFIVSNDLPLVGGDERRNIGGIASLCLRIIG